MSRKLNFFFGKYVIFDHLINFRYDFWFANFNLYSC